MYGYSTQYKFDLLSEDIYRNIPKSTRYSWKSKDFCKMVGYDMTFTDEKLELIKNFLTNLRNVYFTYLLEKENPLTVLFVDDGIENKGFVSNAIENQEMKLNKLIAQKDIHFSNSMVEAVNKPMKYDFLFRAELLDIEHAQRFLETAVEQYNHRPHSALFGLTPYEVFHGRAPNKTFFKPQMEQAKLLRKAENKTLLCDNCAFTTENQEEKQK